MKVLVVEDDLEINELLGEYLALENIKYLQAITGRSGIHQANELHPDAIILDLMLPDIDGFEVARALTTCRATFDIPIVILSCMCQEGDREKGFAAGALHYMNKPFLPDDLLAVLRDAFAWRSGLRSPPLSPPGGTVTLGDKDATIGLRAINAMMADLFARTNLPDAEVGQIRQAIESLGEWARQWNRDHKSQIQVRVDYKMTSGTGGEGETGGGIEWRLSESEPGLLGEAFFKPAAVLTTTWLQLLAKTGAARFEKDSTARTVRFTRTLGVDGEVAPTPTVPVVEIDGTRYPTRLRDEALAAKRK
ncbi:MAG: response regulator [Phycisphaerales bacterium]|nr:response regulator [Phycisphaerales bacterium]